MSIMIIFFNRHFALELYVVTLEQFCNGQYTRPMPSDAQVLCQIADGINYLHSKEFSHANLNPQTILISQGQPVRIKISDFGLKKFVDFPKLIPNDDGNSRPQRDVISISDLGDQPPPHKIHKLKIKNELQSHSFPNDDDEASLSSLTDASIDQIENPWISTNPTRDHPGIWMLAGSWSEFTDHDGNVLIQVNPTVHGDVFAAGCLFFYFLTRGSHPFGDTGTILANISANNPINLNSKVDLNYNLHCDGHNLICLIELEQNHFANKSIRNLIGEPPKESGTQWLQIAGRTFRDVLPRI